MATTRRKVLGTATLSFGGTALALGVTSIPAGVSPEIEVDDAAAFGDAVKTHVGRNLTSLNSFDVECIFEGVAPTLKVGQTGTVALSLTFRDGVGTDTTLATAISEECTLIKREFGSVEVDGDRKASVTFTFQPVGGADRSGDVDFSHIQASG